MGNFLPSVRNPREAKVLAIKLIKIYVLLRLAKLLVWFIRNLKSRSVARRLLRERNGKHYHFEKVDGEKAKLILSSDVTELMGHLMAKRLTSVDLVNFYGNRC